MMSNSSIEAVQKEMAADDEKFTATVISIEERAELPKKLAKETKKV